MSFYVITCMLVLPLFGAIFQGFFSRLGVRQSVLTPRLIALVSSVSSCICGLAIFFMLKGAPSGEVFERFAWLGNYAVDYEVGVDGMNILLVLLISVAFPILILSEWDRKKSPRGVFGLLLLSQVSLLGVAVSRNLFLIFLFWCLSVLPVYFLASIWGEEENEKAAFRYMISSSFGNILFFLSLILIYFSVEPQALSLKELSGGRLKGATFVLLNFEFSQASLGYLFFLASFVFRVPIFPFHGWFNDLLKKSSPIVLIVTGGLFSAVALNLMTRLSYGLFSSQMAYFAHSIVLLGAVNTIFGAIAASTQKDLRSFAGYVCISFIGLTLMGIGSMDSVGVVGTVFEEFSLGLVILGFGLFCKIYCDRLNTYSLYRPEGKLRSGGLVHVAPQYALFTAIICAAFIGLPGSPGFIGQSLIVMGSYLSNPVVVAVTALGVLFLSYGVFWVFNSIFLGPLQAVDGNKAVIDLSAREVICFISLIAVLVAMGLFPNPLVTLVKQSVISMAVTPK